MPLDFTKLNDAVAKVVDLAKSHADTSDLVSAANAARDAALADLVQAQADIDALASQLMAAAKSPAEAAGLAAVASALIDPALIAPVPEASPEAPVVPVIAPAPAATSSPSATFLPGDPRAPKVAA